MVILIANVFTRFVTKHCFSDDTNNDENWYDLASAYLHFKKKD
ncbi:hypothetical protein [Riemerella columbipharyngis]|nr:hypothetical protein [Riemerella columbipharyngis]